MGRAVSGPAIVGAPGRRAVVTAASLGFAAMGVTVDGTVAPGFEAVRDVFGATFERGGDIGAAVAVYRDGRPVVDLWAGEADATTHRPWSDDTIVGIFSGTKGLTAIAAHLLVERGELDVDAPVARYWPEFAAAGKGDVPVRWLLGHRVGLPHVEGDFTLAEVLAGGSRSCRPWPPRRRPGSRGRSTATTCAPTAGWSARSSAGRRAARPPAPSSARRSPSRCGLSDVDRAAGERARALRAGSSHRRPR